MAAGIIVAKQVGILKPIIFFTYCGSRKMSATATIMLFFYNNMADDKPLFYLSVELTENVTFARIKQVY